MATGKRDSLIGNDGRPPRGGQPKQALPREAASKTAPPRDDRNQPRTLDFPTMEATIEVAGLRKRFGPAQALDGMSFTVLPGQVTGFVGPNGAGKSTTMRMILGLDRPDAGTARINGKNYHELGWPLRYSHSPAEVIDTRDVDSLARIIAVIARNW